MKTRICITCKIEKSIEEFISKGIKNGIRTREYSCLDCKRELKKKQWQNWKSKRVKNYFKNYFIKNPLILKAKNKVRWAIKSGCIKKNPCVICNELKVEAHHPDYNKPLEVIWMCHKHHIRFHTQNLTLSCQSVG